LTELFLKMKVAPFLDHHVDYFVLVLFVFVVLGLVFLVPRQEIGYEQRLRNDLFCVKWDLKP